EAVLAIAAFHNEDRQTWNQVAERLLGHLFYLRHDVYLKLWDVAFRDRSAIGNALLEKLAEIDPVAFVQALLRKGRGAKGPGQLLQIPLEAYAAVFRYA